MDGISSRAFRTSPALDFECLDVMLFNKELALEIEFSINRQKQDIDAAVDTFKEDFITDDTRSRFFGTEMTTFSSKESSSLKEESRFPTQKLHLATKLFVICATRC